MLFSKPVYKLQPTIDRIIEFKGLNRNPVIDDGEMRTMLNMSGDDYPCLTQRKPRGVFADDDTEMWEAMDVQAPVALLQKGRLEDGANVKKLAVIDHVGNDYIFKYDGASYSGLGLSSATQMVAINTRICFFPEKLWFNVQTKEYGSMEALAFADEYMIKSDGYYQTIVLPDHVTQNFSLSYIENDARASSPTISATIDTEPAENTIVSVTVEYYRKTSPTVTMTATVDFKSGKAQPIGTTLPTGYAGHVWSVSYNGDKTFTLKGIIAGQPVGEPTRPTYAEKTYMASIVSVEYVDSESGTIDASFSNFKEGDVVDIYGSLVVGEEMYDYTQTPVSVRLEKVEGEKICIPDGTFLELTEAGVQTAFIQSPHVERKCPNIQFVIEYGNRLWGVDNANNEIRASKLGDPTNWYYFQGESIDSYAATQGTDGEFTGAAAYSNHLLFFKDDYIHKVYGTKPSQFQIEIATCYGLEKGSHKSIQIVNDTVFYKSRIGIMGYSGGTPFLVSDAFGKDVYKNVIAGDDGRKYYCSMEKDDGTYAMMVFDVSTGLWHVEDNARATEFCYYKGKLLMVINGTIMYANADTGWSNMPWAAEFGAFDEFVEFKKIYSKIRMNIVMEQGSTLTIKIKVDGGDWETVNSIQADERFEDNTIIVPRRCDRYSVRLEGTGKVQIRTMTRQYRQGTDRRDVIA